ncbi:hypothetical protein D3C80_728940 [compost metagenome]
MREKRIGLEDHRDIALIGGQHGHILVADQDASVGRMFEAGQHAQRRRLAATGGAEQRHQRAGLDGERQVGNGGESAEGLADILEGDGTGLYGNHAVFSWARGTEEVAGRPATRFSRRRRRSPTMSWKPVMTVIITTISMEE